MSTGKRLRFEILKRDNFRCVYCGATPGESQLHVDHVVPRATGGTDDPVNLVAACADCNGGKSSVELHELRDDVAAPISSVIERARAARELVEHQSAALEATEDLVETLRAEWRSQLGSSAPRSVSGAFRRLVHEHPVSEITDAIRATALRGLGWNDRARYFFGVLKRKRAEREQASLTTQDLWAKFAEHLSEASARRADGDFRAEVACLNEARRVRVVSALVPHAEADLVMALMRTGDYAQALRVAAKLYKRGHRGDWDETAPGWWDRNRGWCAYAAALCASRCGDDELTVEWCDGVPPRDGYAGQASELRSSAEGRLAERRARRQESERVQAENLRARQRRAERHRELAGVGRTIHSDLVKAVASLSFDGPVTTEGVAESLAVATVQSDWMLASDHRFRERVLRAMKEAGYRRVGWTPGPPRAGLFDVVGAMVEP